MKDEKPIECKGCNTFDVGSILDNSETLATVERVFETEGEAQTALARLTEKARDVESEPCQITSQIEQVAEGYKLTAQFIFSCQAEVVIFQLGTRTI